jgi:hypothetical protein
MPLLTSIRKYMEICEEERELERIASDQTRLLGRGVGRDPGRLLREEKMRKRVGKEKPKVWNSCSYGLILLSDFLPNSLNNSCFHHCPHGRKRTGTLSSYMAKASHALAADGECVGE